VTSWLPACFLKLPSLSCYCLTSPPVGAGLSRDPFLPLLYPRVVKGLSVSKSAKDLGVFCSWIQNESVGSSQRGWCSKFWFGYGSSEFRFGLAWVAGCRRLDKLRSPADGFFFWGYGGDTRRVIWVMFLLIFGL
jgi:hypothetical protein